MSQYKTVKTSINYNINSDEIIVFVYFILNSKK